jgi:hypothetical protein
MQSFGSDTDNERDNATGSASGPGRAPDVGRAFPRSSR